MHLAERLVVTLLMLCAVVTISAQNNTYKINDQLFALFNRALESKTSEESMLLADSMYKGAVIMGDKKAECMALTIPLMSYAEEGDSMKVEEHVRRVMEVSERNGYMDYYYWAYYIRVSLFMNLKKYYVALITTNEMLENATAHKNDYGIFTAMRTIGDIHVLRGEYRAAVKDFEAALKYGESKLARLEMATVYIDIANCYGNMRDYKKQLEYCERGLKMAEAERVVSFLRLERLNALGRLGRDEEFMEERGNLTEEEKILLKEPHQEYAEIGLFDAMINRGAQAGYDFIQEMEKKKSSGRVSIDKLKLVYYERIGDYESAYNTVLKMQNYRDSLNQEVISSDVSEVSAQLDNDRLTVELQKSQLHNARKFNIAMLIALIVVTILMAVYVFYRQRTTAMLKESYDQLNEYVDELEVARDKAEQADNMKSMFIQNMSHEIRTPLNAIVGFSQLLTTMGDDLPGEEKTDMTKRISENSELLTVIIDDILDLNTIEMGKYVMKLKGENINDLCRSALETSMHLCPDGVEMTFTTDLPDDYCIETDAKRVKQVLINLLSNATKNTTKGSIRLHVAKVDAPDRLQFSVTDTGIGIPEDKMEEVFERFKKLDTFKQGTGLGLSICRSIAEHLNGSIYIDNTYKDGARFFFDIRL